MADINSALALFSWAEWFVWIAGIFFVGWLIVHTLFTGGKSALRGMNSGLRNMSMDRFNKNYPTLGKGVGNVQEHLKEEKIAQDLRSKINKEEILNQEINADAIKIGTLETQELQDLNIENKLEMEEETSIVKSKQILLEIFNINKEFQQLVLKYSNVDPKNQQAVFRLRSEIQLRLRSIVIKRDELIRLLDTIMHLLRENEQIISKIQGLERNELSIIYNEVKLNSAFVTELRQIQKELKLENDPELTGSIRSLESSENNLNIIINFLIQESRNILLILKSDFTHIEEQIRNVDSIKMDFEQNVNVKNDLPSITRFIETKVPDLSHSLGAVETVLL